MHRTIGRGHSLLWAWLLILLVTRAPLAAAGPYKLLPDEGHPGTRVKVEGDFGEKRPKKIVALWNGEEIGCRWLSPKQVTFNVPHVAAGGKHSVAIMIVGNPTRMNAGKFEVLPKLNGWTPREGVIGRPLEVSGIGWPARQSPTVLFGRKKASCRRTSATTAVVTVPKMKPGQLEIKLRFGSGGKAPTSNVRKITILEKYAKPTIKTFKPTKGEPGETITVKGTNFVHAPVVYFDGKRIVSRVVSEKELTFGVPAKAARGRHKIQVQSQGPFPKTSSTKTLTVVMPKPSITKVEPTSVLPGQTVTVTGSGFVWTAQLLFDGKPISAKVGRNGIRFQVPIDANPGGHSVQVLVGDTPTSTAGSRSNSKPVKIKTYRPKIAVLNPTKAKQGDQVGVGGDQLGYSAGAVVYMNGIAVGTRWGSNRSLLFSVPNEFEPGAYRVWVKIGVAPAAPKSNQLPFEVLRRTPRISRLRPDGAVAGSRIELWGTGLGKGATVLFGGSAIETERVNPTLLRFTIPPGTPPGNVEIRVADDIKIPQKLRVWVKPPKDKPKTPDPETPDPETPDPKTPDPKAIDPKSPAPK